VFVEALSLIKLLFEVKILALSRNFKLKELCQLPHKKGLIPYYIIQEILNWILENPQQF
jgi:hypothetical protein